MDVYFFKNDQQDFAFFPETIRMLKIDANTKNLLEDLKNNISQEEICSKYKLTNESCTELIKKLNQYASVRETNKKLDKEKELDQDPNSLGKLVLNISGACNLKCKYCYADGGTYGSKSKMMTESTAKRAIDLFFERFDKIKHIQIFGGEPLLNFPVMKFICEYVHEKFNKNEIKSLPGIGLVTNGTLVNDAFIDLINKYNLTMTISFDGTPEINDSMRIFKDNSPTSKIILENIKKLKEKTNCPNMIEVTYNKSHVKNNISIKDIVSFVKNIDKDIDIHIAPVTVCNKEENAYALDDLYSFIDSVDDLSMDNQAELYLLLKRYISIIQNKEIQKHICIAGTKMFSVSVSGDIYPCFMFIDNKDFCIGNVSDENILYSDRFNKSIEKFSLFNREKKSECKNCFIRNICLGCLGQNLLETGDIFKTNSRLCDMNRSIIEKLLIRLSGRKLLQKTS